MTFVSPEYIDLALDKWFEPEERRQFCVDPPEMPWHESLSAEQYASVLKANKSWFQAHRARLAEKHPHAKYVAVSQRSAVIFGDSPGEVVDAFYSVLGAQPVYVGKLSGEADVEVLSSPDF